MSASHESRAEISLAAIHQSSNMNQQTTHAPGPWCWQRNNICPGDQKGAYIQSSQQNLIAQVSCRHSNITQVQCEANARLIATAPELLKALQELCDAASRQSTALCVRDQAKEARKIIAKALGQ